MDEKDPQLPNQNPEPQADDGMQIPSTNPYDMVDQDGSDTAAPSMNTFEPDTSGDQALPDFEETIGDEGTMDDGNAGDFPPTGDVGDALSANGSGGANKMRVRILLGITGVLIIVLLATVWYFFLRQEPEEATPTPTTAPTQKPTQIAQTSPSPAAGQTHLECRFGLCVEVPGTGEDLCSSSFDCEQVTGVPTTQPTTSATTPTVTPPISGTTSPSPATTTVPTATATPIGSPVTTNTPTPSPTPTIAPSATNTPTPLATQLPESGTTETTAYFSLFLLLSMGFGGALLLKQQS